MYGVIFVPGDRPRDGQLVFWSHDGERLPAGVGEPAQLTVALPQAGRVRPQTVAGRQLSLGEALPLLLGGSQTDPATAFWGAAARTALQLVASGRLRPDGGAGGWRVGSLPVQEATYVRELAAAMPPQARAAPLPGHRQLLLPAAEPLLRAFLAALADTVAAPAATHPPQAPARVRMSLRIEPASDDLARAPLRAVVQAHGGAGAAMVVDAATLWRDPVAGDASARAEVLRAVRQAARIWSPLERLLDAAVPDQVELDDEEVTDLLGGAAARLAAAGVEVHWPRELMADLTATAVIDAAGPAPAALPAWFHAGEGLALDWQLALGGQPLTTAERESLAAAHRPVVRLRDRWVLVDPAVAHKARRPPRRMLPPLPALGASLAGAVEVDGEQIELSTTGWLAQLRQQLAADPQPVPQPPVLAATLRDYQLRGLAWLARITGLGLGGCLADDMGLGKTITVIALHLHRQAEPATAGTTLVICPASLLGNWEQEIKRFAPGVPVRRFHGTGRSADAGPGGFLLTTYATMRRDPAPLAAHRWGLLVADEAQHVKNPRSATARALRTLAAQGRVALTGTPVENHLGDLWAILDWTSPGLLGTQRQFQTRWAAPVENGADPAAAQRLSRLVAPFLLRRRKTDPGIAPELPRKTVTDRPVALTAEQAGLYEAVVREIMAQIRASGGMQRRGLILKLLTGLKQICNHPAQFLGEQRPRLAGRSGKLELLDELVATILAEQQAVLVFTQYVAMGRLLQRHLHRRGVPAQLLHGGTPVAERDELVRRFQDGEVPVFLLSLKAAGTGLNLTRAEHVIHYDRWWNPAVEEQATDRAYRIGQTRPVQVHRMIAEGTVEDRIAALLRAKQELADAVLGSGPAALSELSDEDLNELVTLREAA